MSFRGKNGSSSQQNKTVKPFFHLSCQLIIDVLLVLKGSELHSIVVRLLFAQWVSQLSLLDSLLDRSQVPLTRYLHLDLQLGRQRFKRFNVSKSLQLI